MRKFTILFLTLMLLASGLMVRDVGANQWAASPDRGVLKEITTPSGIPQSKTVWIYSKDSGGVSHLYVKYDDGTETDLGTSSALTLNQAYTNGQTITVNASGNLVVNLSTATKEMKIANTAAAGQTNLIELDAQSAQVVTNGIKFTTTAGTMTNAINCSVATNCLNMGASAITGTGATVSFTRFTLSADGVLTASPALSPAAVIVVSPSAAATTGLDVSSANLTNGVSMGATRLLGTTASIAFTNFTVSGAGAIVGASLNITGAITAATFKQDNLVPASASPQAITLNGGGTGKVQIGNSSTGNIELGAAGGSILVDVLSGVSLQIDQGKFTQTDTADENAHLVTANSVTTNKVASFSGTGVTTGSVVYAQAAEATLAGGFYFRAYDTTGAASRFTVGKYGATVISGNASTTVLTLSAGNEVVTAGNIVLSNGIITVDSTTDAANYFKRNVNGATTAAVLTVQTQGAGDTKPALVITHGATGGVDAMQITNAGTNPAIRITGGVAASEALQLTAAASQTSRMVTISLGTWLGTAGNGAVQMSSTAGAQIPAGKMVLLAQLGTGTHAAQILGSGIYLDEEADGAAQSSNAVYVKTIKESILYLDKASGTAVTVATIANADSGTDLQITETNAAGGGIAFTAAASKTSRMLYGNLGAWLGTGGQGALELVTNAAATIPAGMMVRLNQQGTGQHAAAIDGSVLYIKDAATAPGAGTSYAATIDATNIGALHVKTGAVQVDTTVTATNGVSAGSATNSYMKTDTVTLTNAEVKALRAAPKTLVSGCGGSCYIDVVQVTLELVYAGTNAFTVAADDDLVVKYSGGANITPNIETTGFIDQAADYTIASEPLLSPAARTKASIANTAVVLFNVGGTEIAGNAAADNTVRVKIVYWTHTF